MNWGSCYNGSNNIHFDSPSLMSDGRNYASWKPDAQVNNELRHANGIKSNWEYRKYLQNNADKIIEYNQVEACNGCSSCPVNAYNASSISDIKPPVLYKSCNSDMKSLYLTEYELQSRMKTPVLTQEQLLGGKYPNFD